MQYKYVVGRNGACIHRIPEEKFELPSRADYHDIYRTVQIRGKTQYYALTVIFDSFEDAKAAAIAAAQRDVDKKMKLFAKSQARLRTLSQLTPEDAY